MKKILLVEDEENLVDIVAATLEEEGYSVRKSPTAEDAVTTAPAFLPDLIISDLKMAEMDGFDLLMHLRNQELTQKIPFIFLTSLDDSASQARAKQLGAIAYVTKPFDLDNLLELIRATVQGQDSKNSPLKEPQ